MAKRWGKLIGGLISLVDHETGVPVAQIIHHGEKDDCEQALGRQLIRESTQPLENAVITGEKKSEASGLRLWNRMKWTSPMSVKPAQ